MNKIPKIRLKCDGKETQIATSETSDFQDEKSVSKNNTQGFSYLFLGLHSFD